MRWRIAAAVLLLATVLPATTRASSPAGGVPELGGLSVGQLTGLATETARAVQDGAMQPPATGNRIAILASGVGVPVFPESLRRQITGTTSDAVGYGTYAAAVLLQLDPAARLTSFNVYSGKAFDPARLVSALEWIAANPGQFDGVLLAFPPGEFLDPISAAMQAGEWTTMLDVVSDHAIQTGAGPFFGLPASGPMLARLTAHLPERERKAVGRYQALVARWTKSKAAIDRMVSAGLPVVAPAGDTGSNLQTIFGLGNLPSVVTVGGSSGDRVSPRSASGPSIDGRVKPDLLAPTGVVGLFPQTSVVADALRVQGVLDPTLKPSWPAGEPYTDARARLDSSMTAAAVVATGMAAMRAQGVSQVRFMRGALTAASVPLAGVQVWRQGAGLLRFLPSAHFAGSRPLALAHGDLGAEPASGAWSSIVPIHNGAARGGSVSVTDFAGVAPDGSMVGKRAQDRGSSSPVVRVTNGGAEIALPLGNDRYEGGLYCGYSNVSIPGTSGEVRPGVAASGIPAGVEQVPTCFVEGSRLRTFGFYIHDMPAENLTHALLPDLPVAGSLLRHTLMILPIDPLDTKLAFRVTGQDGFADFPNVVPGFYRLRQFSDYGSPVRTDLVDEKTRDLLGVEADLGEKSAYQEFAALVLSPVCTRQVRSAAAASAGDPCGERFLKDAFGDKNVSFHRPSGTFLVNAGPVSFHVAFDFIKKMPGPAVTSRYIDLLDAGDFEYLSAPVGLKAAAPALEKLTGRKLQAWRFTRAPDGGVEAAYNPGTTILNAADDRLGIAKYPFAMTTPNYKMHMSLNFSYELTNTVLAVVVQVGDEVALGVVSPAGKVQTPTLGPKTPLTLDGLAASGRADGLANFEFRMLPRGASQGTIWFVFAPAPGLAPPLASARVAEMSFELDTWVNPLWPPIAFGEYASPVQGHSFVVDSNYSPRQMSAATCRQVSSGGGTTSRVCEDWTVMVHSPKHDAATFDIWDMASKRSVLRDAQSAGMRYFDPKRGVHDFSWRIAHSAKSVAELEVVVPHDFKTNGRFWEQLALPMEFIRAYPDPVVFRIVDNEPGMRSANFGRTAAPSGSPVEVAPYVPFAGEAAFLDLRM